tara:strand:+ start:477 stop:641 length:165 start_codon:yes stop_codon:yes gene_type:complete
MGVFVPIMTGLSPDPTAEQSGGMSPRHHAALPVGVILPIDGKGLPTDASDKENG